MADSRYGDRDRPASRRSDSIFDDEDRREGRETWGGGSDWSGGRGSSQGSSGSSTFDDHYLGWRERQIRQLDQDYEEYCRDRQQQFETDFHSWRQGRQGQAVSQSGSSSGGEQSSPASENAAATTAGGGGEASATESSTGSSATSGSGARTGRKSEDRK